MYTSEESPTLRTRRSLESKDKRLSWENISVAEVLKALIPIKSHLFDTSGALLPYKASCNFSQAEAVYDWILKRLRYPQSVYNRVWLHSQLKKNSLDLRNQLLIAQMNCLDVLTGAPVSGSATDESSNKAADISSEYIKIESSLSFSLNRTSNRRRNHVDEIAYATETVTCEPSLSSLETSQSSSKERASRSRSSINSTSDTQSICTDITVHDEYCAEKRTPLLPGYEACTPTLSLKRKRNSLGVTTYTSQIINKKLSLDTSLKSSKKRTPNVKRISNVASDNLLLKSVDDISVHDEVITNEAVSSATLEDNISQPLSLSLKRSSTRKRNPRETSFNVPLMSSIECFKNPPNMSISSSTNQNLALPHEQPSHSSDVPISSDPKQLKLSTLKQELKHNAVPNAASNHLQIPCSFNDVSLNDQPTIKEEDASVTFEDFVVRPSLSFKQVFSRRRSFRSETLSMSEISSDEPLACLAEYSENSPKTQVSFSSDKKLCWTIVSVGEISSAMLPFVDRLFNEYGNVIVCRNKERDDTLLSRVYDQVLDLIPGEIPKTSVNRCWLSYQLKKNVKTLRDILYKKWCDTRRISSPKNNMTEYSVTELNWETASVVQIIAAMLPFRDQLVGPIHDVCKFAKNRQKSTSAAVLNQVLNSLEFPTSLDNRLWLANQIKGNINNICTLLKEEGASHEKGIESTFEAKPSKMEISSDSHNFPHMTAAGSTQESLNHDIKPKQLHWSCVQLSDLISSMLPLYDKLFGSTVNVLRFTRARQNPECALVLNEVLDKLNFPKTVENQIWLSHRLRINNRKICTLLKQAAAETKDELVSPKKNSLSKVNPLDLVTPEQESDQINATNGDDTENRLDWSNVTADELLTALLPSKHRLFNSCENALVYNGNPEEEEAGKVYDNALELLGRPKSIYNRVWLSAQFRRNVRGLRRKVVEQNERLAVVQHPYSSIKTSDSTSKLTSITVESCTEVSKENSSDSHQPVKRLRDRSLLSKPIEVAPPVESEPPAPVENYLPKANEAEKMFSTSVAEGANDSMTVIKEEPTYPMGTMFWAKVGSHPWWPCMVYYSPDNKTFFRRLGAGRGYIQHHVQYFGPLVERGWVGEASMIPFEGKAAYDAHAANYISKAKHKKMASQMFSVNSRRKELWDASWKEAEEALPLSLADRLFTYGRTYASATADDIPKLLNNAETSDESSDESDSESSDDDDSSVSSSPSPSVQKQKRGRPSKSFMLSPKIGTKRRRTSSNSSQKTEFMSTDLMSPPVKKQKREPKVKLKKEKHPKPVSVVYEFQKLRYSAPSDKKQLICYLCARPALNCDPASVDNNQSEPVLSCANKCGTAFHPSCLQAVIGGPVGHGSETACSTIEDVKPVVQPLVEASLTLMPTVLGGIDTMPLLSVKMDETASVKSDSIMTKDLEDSNGFGILSCGDCQNKIRRCLVCHKPCTDDVTSLAVQRCSMNACRRVYHTQCLVDTELTEFSHQQNNNQIICPSHNCHVCSLERPGSNRSTLRLVRCLRCPSVYHTGDACIPVGSIVLSNTYILCPRHVHYPNPPPDATIKIKKAIGRPSMKSSQSTASLTGLAANTASFSTGATVQPPASPAPSSQSMAVKKSVSTAAGGNANSVINVTWCFKCSKGGELICCERCPASFHQKCSDLDEVPDVFHCRTCSVGRFPRYGEFMWGKVGHYRWWPCETIHPRHIPAATLALPHQLGQFVVHFFGTGEYQWVSCGRVFPFEEGDEVDGSGRQRKRAIAAVVASEVDTDVTGGSTKEGGKLSALERAYKLGLSLAGVGMRKRLERLQSFGNNKNVAKSYKPIKTNYPIGNVRLNRSPLDLSEVSQCDCRPGDSHSEDPCGPTSDCVNRELFFECHPNVCRHGEKCRNQRFTLRQYPAQACFNTEIRGWGLKAEVDIMKGDFVNEYVGDLIDEEEADKRLLWAHENNIHNFYMMKLDGQRIIDAGPRGNLSRFMNHSCSPNLFAQKWMVASDGRVGLFALRDIKSGEELTFNYNLMSMGQEKLVCKCGAPNCSGFLGVPPSKAAPVTSPDTSLSTSAASDQSSSAASTSSATSGATEPAAATPPPPLSASAAVKKKRKSMTTNGKPPASSASTVLAAIVNAESKTEERSSNREVFTEPTLVAGSSNSGSTAPIEQHDSECFRCGDIGELVLCDKPGCIRAYHLICLGLSKLPYGKWFCPWHHCETCGRPSEELCSECPTSYCRQHFKDNILTLTEGKMSGEPWKICMAHEDLLTAMAMSASAS